MFSNAVRNLRGVLTFYPYSYETELKDLVNEQVSRLSRVPSVLASCTSHQDYESDLDLTDVATCMYSSISRSGYPVVQSDYPPAPRSPGPRSLLVARGDAGSYFENGMHYRTVENVWRRIMGVTIQLFVMVQP